MASALVAAVVGADHLTLALKAGHPLTTASYALSLAHGDGHGSNVKYNR